MTRHVPPLHRGTYRRRQPDRLILRLVPEPARGQRDPRRAARRRLPFTRAPPATTPARWSCSGGGRGGGRRAAGPWRLTGSGLLWAESLTRNHRWLERPSSRQDLSAVSPCDDVMLSQDVLEPVLRRACRGVRRRSAVRHGVARVRRRAGRCDGGAGGSGHRRPHHGARRLPDRRRRDRQQRVRKLGIGRSGVGVLEHVAGIMVRADLGSALRDKSFAICQVDERASPASSASPATRWPCTSPTIPPTASASSPRRAVSSSPVPPRAYRTWRSNRWRCCPGRHGRRGRLVRRRPGLPGR